MFCTNVLLGKETVTVNTRLFRGTESSSSKCSKPTNDMLPFSAVCLNFFPRHVLRLEKEKPYHNLSIKKDDIFIWNTANQKLLRYIANFS